MQTEFTAGDQVFVHDGSYWASQARAGQQAPSGRSGVVARQMPYDEPPVFEVVFDDGAEPGSVIVTPDVMVSPVDLAAGLQAAADLAARVAAAAGAHAAAASDASDELTHAVRLASQNASPAE
jgi:hypothetical protein